MGALSFSVALPFSGRSKLLHDLAISSLSEGKRGASPQGVSIKYVEVDPSATAAFCEETRCQAPSQGSVVPALCCLKDEGRMETRG